MAKEKNNSAELWSRRILAWGGLAFVYISALAFLAIGLLLWKNMGRPAGLDQYWPELILFGAAIFTSLLGVNLLRAAGVASIGPSPVLDPGEWADLKEKVVEGNEETVNQYIRLSSLTGFTGVFTKLGLQGLPLAMIGLTIFFSLMFFQDKIFLDLAKLTLGAFIGSFVQKQVGERQGGGGTVELPSGETIKVKSTSPPIA